MSFNASNTVAASWLAIALCAANLAASTAVFPQAQGWLSWRGPQQNGTSLEQGLPDELSLDGDHAWSYPLAGRGTPVTADGRVYTIGYDGDGAEIEELLICLDENTGKMIWEHRFKEFLTDIIYSRFSIGSPVIDAETSSVLCMSSSGLLSCFTRDGELIWQHSLMSEYGRLSFPNGRTGSPVIAGGLAVVHIISSSWGSHGPARDRFLAFDKDTGVSVWSSTPGGPPKDSSFSMPVVSVEKGKQVLFAGLGGGYLVCINLLTGDPIWRFLMATGGVNSSVLLYQDSVIAIHGRENIDNSLIGRMVSIRRGSQPEPGKGPVSLSKSSELWRNRLTAFTSSPVLVGDRIYQTVQTGELACVDAETGRVLWHQKLAPDQLHASPVWGDGKLYVPMNNGSLYIIRPSDEGAEILQKLQLEGNCLGAPAIANGRILVHTTAKLYSLGGKAGKLPPARILSEMPAVGPAARLQVLPADYLARQGESLNFRVRSLDANGRVISESVNGVTWTNIPNDGVAMSADGLLTIAADAEPTVAVLRAELGDLAGTARFRIVPASTYVDDFEDAVLEPHPKERDVRYARPRSHWIGAGLKWEIRELEGDKVLAKTLDRPLFQRTMSLIGHPDSSNYTMSVDIMSDGNRRSMSSGGVVNQRYQIVLKGNHQALEISSNMEVLKESVPFAWQPKIWYRMKTRVDLLPDGSGWVRAKVWPRTEPEPEAWMLEVHPSHAHTHGSPGLYGFAPQSRFRVYLDNVSVIPNE